MTLDRSAVSKFEIVSLPARIYISAPSQLGRYALASKEIAKDMSRKQVVYFIALLLPLLGCNKSQTPEDARKELGRMNIPYSEQAFIESAKNGDMVAVNLFLAAGMNPNAREQQGRLAYQFVASSGSSVLEKQIEFGEALNQIGTPDLRNGATPLTVAAIQDRNEVVKLLMAKGADVNATDRLGFTALIYAAWHGHAGVVKTLIDTGANVNWKPDKINTTAMDAAIEGKYKDVIQILQDAGAEVPNSRSNTQGVNTGLQQIIPKTKEEKTAYAKAQSLLERLHNGEDFAKLAQENSDDPNSKSNGGDIGYFSRGALVPEIDKVAFALNPGDISGIIKREFCYDIIKVEDYKERGTPLEEVHIRDIRISFKTMVRQESCGNRAVSSELVVTGMIFHEAVVES